MINILVKSRFFENKCFWLRQKFSFWERKYREVNRIGLAYSSPITAREASLALEKITEATKPRDYETHIPKIIWVYWDMPIESAPEVVKLSVQSWKALNPGYDVRVINANNIKGHLGFDFFSVFHISLVKLTMAMKTDVLRLYLLSQYGGVWVDATTFCLRPLSTWLPAEARQHCFFTFRHKSVPSRPIEAWFIAAKRHSPVTQVALSLFLRHLFKNRQHAIFVSNRRKMMEKLGIQKYHPDLVYAELVFKAEVHGFMPYFSVAYFLNESLSQCYSRDAVDRFLALSNNHVTNDGSYSDFKNSFVSKQTYKGDYQEREVYIWRKQYLKNLLDSKGA